MHWDREWYFTTEASRILLVNNMEEILTRLEQDEEYKYYVLDGQTAVLEDYFAVVPDNRPRVKALVERGKLIIEYFSAEQLDGLYDFLMQAKK